MFSLFNFPGWLVICKENEKDSHFCVHTLRHKIYSNYLCKKPNKMADIDIMLSFSQHNDSLKFFPRFEQRLMNSNKFFVTSCYDRNQWILKYKNINIVSSSKCYFIDWCIFPVNSKPALNQKFCSKIMLHIQILSLLNVIFSIFIVRFKIWQKPIHQFIMQLI